MRTEMLVMRDGVRLATDIHLPAGDGPWPVILERTPYGRGGDQAPAINAHGYAAVFQDCRGRYGSEGRFEKYLGDGPDGADTCAWITEQQWCDGRICTVGLSYGAHAQAALGCLDPPGLVAQVLECGGFNDAWASGVLQGGAFELRQANWAYHQAILSPEAAADPLMRAALEAEDIRAWFAAWPWQQGASPVRHHPAYEARLFDQICHGARDGFWKQVGLWADGFHHRYSRADCVHVSSWFDPYVSTATGNYRGLSAAGRGRQRLILGPWTHGAHGARVAGDVDFGAEAPVGSWAGDWLDYQLRHFDAVTRGLPNDEPSVRVFVMGGGSGRRTEAGRLDHGGRWITAADWPVPGAVPAVWHLHNDGRLDPQVPQERAKPLSYDFDPADPVPTIGGNFSSFEPIAEPGSFDQVGDARFFGCRPPFLPLAARRDVLAFQTAPLTEAVQVVGPVEVVLFVATDGPDTDFTAKLIDVYPSSPDYPRGYAMLLADTILRLRYAEDPSEARLRRAGEVVRIRLVLPIGNLFEVGHRIRLDVSSSNFPKFDVNLNTGEPEGVSRCRRVAVNTVFADAARPSRVVLPLVAV